MKTLFVWLAVSAAMPALADPKLADKKNCLACHGVDKKNLGPALKEVAAKYAGKPDAAVVLAGKIQQGSSGAWGNVPMPPNDVTGTEAKQLAEWVLSLR
jgi:cytochrome c